MLGNGVLLILRPLCSPSSPRSALFAIWLALKESRRNNRVILKVKECKGSFSQHINEGEFYIFEVFVQNHGMSLFNIAASLGFRDKRGAGWCSFNLDSGYKPHEPFEPHTVIVDSDRYSPRFPVYPEFARGMVAKFYLKSNGLSPGAEHMLSALTDPSKQDACLQIYSQDYLACTIRIGGLRTN